MKAFFIYFSFKVETICRCKEKPTLHLKQIRALPGILCLEGVHDFILIAILLIKSEGVSLQPKKDILLPFVGKKSWVPFVAYEVWDDDLRFCKCIPILRVSSLLIESPVTLYIGHSIDKLPIQGGTGEYNPFVIFRKEYRFFFLEYHHIRRNSMSPGHIVPFFRYRIILMIKMIDSIFIIHSVGVVDPTEGRCVMVSKMGRRKRSPVLCPYQFIQPLRAVNCQF